VWVQQLAGMMGVTSPGPSLAGGTNYAFGGALTGYDRSFPGGGGEPYVGDQVSLYLAAHPGTLPSNALYVFWARANDIFNGANPTTAVANLSANISTLYADGARDFLWLDMPPLGNTPDIIAMGETAFFNALSQEYNADWSSTIAMLDADDPGIKMVGVNVSALVLAMLADPSAYGFTNVTTPAQGALGINPNTYLFWDGVHPTTMGYYWVANLAYDDLSQSQTIMWTNA
jgi:phospholipase/lecithinase/hemolysin